MKYEYDIRQIDATAYDIDSENKPIWTWNSSIHIDTMTTSAQDHRQAFIRKIHELCPGLNFKRSGLYIDFDGDVYELRHKDDDMPILAAIPNF